MRKAMPEKVFHEVPGLDGCSCNACPYMRLNSLEKLENCLINLSPCIKIEEDLRLKALAPIKKMLELSK
ncbi:MAG: quinolinate synthase NadA, partial [Synechococcaceae bacterium WB6_3A_227]|nr:quinolinate synthase NadA [Synechococcaceae bacterium WB6_3A_227]